MAARKPPVARPGRHGEGIGNDELSLWREVVRDVRPLAGRGAGPQSTAPPAPAAETGGSTAEARLRREPISVPPPRRSGAAPGLDKRSAQRLRRGQYPIEARIDLHGVTQQEAHAALSAFVMSTHEASKRCLLVITGKGLGRAEGGVLRQMVPRWLDQAPLRDRVLAVIPAQPRHGGSGALYVLLRRKR